MTGVMLIVPHYITSVKKGDKTIYSIRILTEGGNSLWSEENQPIQDVLIPNDLFSSRIKTVKTSKHTVHYCEIDTTKTDVHQMWDWTETSDPSIHCWRTFHYTLIGKQPFMSVPVNELLIPLKLTDVLNVILNP